MKSARYIITCATDRTPVHADFLACLQAYARSRRAEIVVVPVAYRNPTSRYQEQYEDGEWAEEIQSYLCDERRTLAPNLVLYGDVRVQPTASRPLTGFEVFTAGQSAIIGHPKRALEVIPTARKFPRLLMTTSAVTVANYSSTRAGKQGDAHHVLGALAVDIDERGNYYPRHVSYDARTKSFTDIDRRYSASGVEKAPPAESLTPGDIHVGQPSADGKAEAAVRAVFKAVRPKHLVLHDVLDGDSCNPHENSYATSIRRLSRCVEGEVMETCDALADFAAWGDGTHQTHIVPSNHDCFLDRWLEDYRLGADATNLTYWHFLSHRKLIAGKPALQLEFERLYPNERVHFVGSDEDLTIKNVAHRYHGHKGPTGARGSAMAFRRLGNKVTLGHSHSPKILDGVVQTGVYGNLRPKYTEGVPSSWLNAMCILHADGKRQLLIAVDGKVTA